MISGRLPNSISSFRVSIISLKLFSLDSIFSMILSAKISESGKLYKCKTLVLYPEDVKVGFVPDNNYIITEFMPSAILIFFTPGFGSLVPVFQACISLWSPLNMIFAGLVVFNNSFLTVLLYGFRGRQEIPKLLTEKTVSSVIRSLKCQDKDGLWYRRSITDWNLLKPLPVPNPNLKNKTYSRKN